MKSAVLVALIAVSLLLVACDDPDEDIDLDGNSTPTTTARPDESPSPFLDASPTQTPLPTTPVETPINATPVPPPPGWASLENKEYGYTLNFPADWHPTARDLSGPPFTSNSDLVTLYSFPPPSTGIGALLPPDKLKLEILVYENDDRLGAEEWIERARSNSECSIDVSSRADYAPHSTNAEGIKEISRADCPGFEPFESIAWYITIEERVLHIAGTPANSPYLEKVEQLVESLRLR